MSQSTRTTTPDWRDYPDKETMGDAELEIALVEYEAAMHQLYRSPLERYAHAYRVTENGDEECGIGYLRDDGLVAFSPYWFFPEDATSNRVTLHRVSAFFRLGAFCTRKGYPFDAAPHQEAA
jgi:hypothetical protein